MTKKKALKRTFVAEIDLKATFAELVPAKKKGRVPRHVGQGRSSKHVRLHGITADELKERLDAAKGILEKGVTKSKVPEMQKTIDELVAANKELSEKVKGFTENPKDQEKPKDQGDEQPVVQQAPGDVPELGQPVKSGEPPVEQPAGDGNGPVKASKE